MHEGGACMGGEGIRSGEGMHGGMHSGGRLHGRGMQVSCRWSEYSAAAMAFPVAGTCSPFSATCRSCSFDFSTACRESVGQLAGGLWGSLQGVCGGRLEVRSVVLPLLQGTAWGASKSNAPQVFSSLEAF